MAKAGCSLLLYISPEHPHRPYLAYPGYDGHTWSHASAHQSKRHDMNRCNSSQAPKSTTVNTSLAQLTAHSHHPHCVPQI
ncbi:hypothetical protein GBA52_008409 [Prunus armeniaca]|nr:hypothetical protein GBA52_008409 [Prunus armeniaca]